MSKIRRSLAFSLADTYLGLPLQIVGTMLLSRLLTPAEMGVFAVGAVFAAFASTFRDFGVAEYLIQEKDLTDTKLRAALTVNICLSWAIGLTLLAIAPFAATFYRHPGIAEVMRVQSLSFVLMPFGAVTLAYFRRELNFRPIFVASLISNIATFTVGLGCALQGQSYMSLAWSSLAGVIATVGTAMWFRPANFPRWPGLRGLRPVFHFGRFASGVYIFGQLGRGTPEMMLGRVQGLADVAMFSRGGGLVELFNRLVLRGVLPVCQPYFAKDHRELGTVVHGYRFSMAFLTAVGWPALLFLALASFPAVRILYGSQWTPAAHLAKILCGAAAVELVHYLAMEALLAVGEAKRANVLQMQVQAVRILCLLAVVPYGLNGASWGLLAAGIVGLLLAQRAMYQVVGLRWVDVARSCWKSLLVTFTTGVPLALLYGLMPQGESNYFRWIAAAALLAIVTWLASLRAVDHPVWTELLDIGRHILAGIRPIRGARQSDPLASQLAVEIERQLGCAAARLERAVSVRDNSIVYLARLGGQGAPQAAIKCCRVPGSDRIDAAVAQSQFEALRRIHRAFDNAGPHFSVPEPLWFRPSLGVYAMTWVDGDSLTDRLGRFGAESSLFSAFESTGAWLGTFHRAGPARAGPADFTDKALHLATMRLSAVDHPRFISGLQVLDESFSRVQSPAIQISWLHGDCKTDNFLLTRDGVCGIDITLSHENAIEHDLAQFLNQVDLLTSDWRYVHRRPARSALHRAFMLGYGRTGPAVNEPLLHWIRLWSALTFWHTCVAEGGPMTPKRWVLNHAFAKLVSRLQASLKTACST